MVQKHVTGKVVQKQVIDMVIYILWKQHDNDSDHFCKIFRPQRAGFFSLNYL